MCNQKTVSLVIISDKFEGHSNYAMESDCWNNIQISGFSLGYYDDSNACCLPYDKNRKTKSLECRQGLRWGMNPKNKWRRGKEIGPWEGE